MKKKISIVLLSMLVLVLAVGCSGDKPEATVAEYIEAMKDFDVDGMASKVNPKKRADLNEFNELYNEEDSMEKYFLDYIESNAKKIKYEINDSEIDGDKASVNVDFKYVDGAPLFKATFAEYMKEMFAIAFTDLEQEITEEEYGRVFVDTMEEQRNIIEETFTEKNLDIELIKIEDQWYIDEVSKELLDVAMTNILSVGEELEDSFDFDQ